MTSRAFDIPEASGQPHQHRGRLAAPDVLYVLRHPVLDVLNLDTVARSHGFDTGQRLNSLILRRRQESRFSRRARCVPDVPDLVSACLAAVASLNSWPIPAAMR